MQDGNYSDLRLVLIDMKSAAVLPGTDATFCSVLRVKGLSSLGKKPMDRPSCPSFLLFHIYSYILMSAKQISRLSKIYYSPQGYWKGVVAVEKLAQAAKVSDDVARNWLIRQALWQVYLPAPWHIPRPKFDVPVPNDVHQADLLYLPHDHPPRSRKTFKYVLTVIDVASRYKDAEPLTTKEANEVASSLERIYKRGP